MGASIVVVGIVALVIYNIVKQNRSGNRSKTEQNKNISNEQAKVETVVPDAVYDPNGNRIK